MKRKYFQNIDFHTWLFILAILVYLLTRLLYLPRFPIFFFTDEAIQTMAAEDLIRNGMRSPNGVLFPTYFKNGGQYNLSLSVYLQVLPTLLLPRSVWITRGVAALATLIAAVSLGLILREFFKVKFYWLGPLLLSIIPTWFLHSRTAFETTLMASMYAGFLYFYLCYRNKNPHYLYLALLFGGFTFYAYSPGQIIIVTTGLLLLFSDLSYHWQHRKIALLGFFTLILLAAPYIRFRIEEPVAMAQHLSILKSYWVENTPLLEKFQQFFKVYLQGLNPRYYFLYNDLELIRHQVQDRAAIPLFTFPFFIIGFLKLMKQIKSPASRVLLAALLAAPTGAALVSLTITRILVIIVPLTIIIAIGFEQAVIWLSRLLKNKLIPAMVLIIVLTIFSFSLLVQSVRDGPTWFDNYGLYGLQYGGQTLFDEIIEFQAGNPNKRLVMSPSWANGTDVIIRFFLGDSNPIEVGTIEAYTINYLPLDKDTVFIMIPEEYDWMKTTGKFKDIEVLKTIPYPNGKPGFYFVSLAYVDNIESIFDEEIAQRRQLREKNIEIFDQQVLVQYPLLDINEIDQVFDGDTNTLVRTFEANPLIINLKFDNPVQVSALTAYVGGARTRLSVKLKLADSGQDKIFSNEVAESNVVRPVTFNFEQAFEINELTLEVLNVNDGEFAHVHLWEVSILP